ncbi:hypothetical protein ACHRV1_11285 [Flavobacterium aquidurense]|jgi:hypothetical protein|uniref:hypothetical protein n=1 Tax=Flavobacterium aquidurense TaxID=362413 RepID=UPI000923A07B|nr:hypothetical protein [Flavobacterium aquidurense]OXA72280.1 hypothetical protein B0A67_08625 [Flavobacterium aquidurense]SHH00720.1 hypothetical protein SAMN05444481_11034 [Flavobacterium frigidimaris]
MKTRFSILIMGLAIFFFFGSAKPTFSAEDTTLVINKIKIEITGLSTVGKYNCSNTFSIKDTVYINSIKKNIFNTEIKMSDFDCGNKIMTKDLQGTVKVKKFPNSTVYMTDIKPSGQNYKCNLNFLITNKTLKYKDFILYNTDKKIEGTLNLKFSDLEMEAPVKMAGLIKVKDEIVINFSLYKN